jgi:hypothetical protein
MSVTANRKKRLARVYKYNTLRSLPQGSLRKNAGFYFYHAQSLPSTPIGGSNRASRTYFSKDASDHLAVNTLLALKNLFK